jgi:hypothetical protein
MLETKEVASIIVNPDAPKKTKNPYRISAREAMENAGMELSDCMDESPACCSEGCMVEPDGRCEHGCPAVLIACGLI